MKAKLIFSTALLLSLLAASSASASGRLDSYCLSFVRPHTVAALCDPGAAMSGSLRLAGQSALVDHFGAAALDRSGALARGERVQAAWRNASPRALLYVSGGGQGSVFPLSRLGSRASVALASNGDLRARGNRGSLIGTSLHSYSSPPLASSPQVLLGMIRGSMSALRSERSLRRLCALLDSGSRRFYDYFYGLPDQVGCPGALKVFFLGSELPSERVQFSSSRLVRLARVSPGKAYAYISLLHRFAPDGDKPQSIKSDATLLLRRDSGGAWRVANPQSLMPLNVYRARARKPAHTPREAWSEWRELVSQGRLWQQNYLAWQFPFARMQDPGF